MQKIGLKILNTNIFCTFAYRKYKLLMAKNLETYTLRVEMIMDLMDVYDKVAPRCLTREFAYKETVKQKAKRFYVTPKQVYQRINMYIKGKPEAIESLKPLTRQMYRDIIGVILTMQKHPNYRNCSLLKLCSEAVLRPAPRFYITPRWFREILANYIKGQLDEHGRDIKKIKHPKLEYI